MRVLSWCNPMTNPGSSLHWNTTANSKITMASEPCHLAFSILGNSAPAYGPGLNAKKMTWHYGFIIMNSVPIEWFCKMMDVKKSKKPFSHHLFPWTVSYVLYFVSNPITFWLFTASSLKAIEKAIVSSNLGLTPNNDGEVIRLTLPQLTSERRKVLHDLVFSKVSPMARQASGFLLLTILVLTG